MQMLGNMVCRHREEWLGHIEMMTALSAFYNWMKRGKDKGFLSQLACFIDCIHFWHWCSCIRFLHVRCKIIGKVKIETTAV